MASPAPNGPPPTVPVTTCDPSPLAEVSGPSLGTAASRAFHVLSPARQCPPFIHSATAPMGSADIPWHHEGSLEARRGERPIVAQGAQDGAARGQCLRRRPPGIRG